MLRGHSLLTRSAPALPARARRVPRPASASLDAHTLFSWVSAASITATALPLALRPPDAPVPVASYGGVADAGGAARDARTRNARALHVALTTVAFLPYINFAAFGALTALDLARGRPAASPPTARAAAATALYACPLLLLAATGDAHAAVASTFLCAAHFTAENVLRGAEAADAARETVTGSADDDALLAAAADVAALSDTERLTRWDARLALARAKKSDLVELAARAGIKVRASATRSALAAALAQAAGLDEPTGVTPAAPWLVDELARAGEAEVGAAAARAARRRKKKSVVE